MPLHEVLYEHLRRSETERLDSLRREREALDTALLTNLAVNGPDKLTARIRDYEARLWRPQSKSRSGPLTPDEIRRALEIVAVLHTHPALSS